ncbi:MAG: PRC-barrel domain-containing protein [Candidatus Thorarchaeota archaeon]
MKLSKPICCQDIKKMDVMDASGKKIGKILNLSFTFDGSLKLKHFILGGSRIEEFLESINLKPDEDPVFESTAIKKIDTHIHLDTSVNSLKNFHDTIADDEIKFSDLQKLEIVDKDGVKVGRAINVDFDIDGRTALIAGGGLLEEKLEAFGLKEDVDIIVPFQVIVSIDESIRLSVSKDELDTSLDGILRERATEIKNQREAAAAHTHSRKARVPAHWRYGPA